MHKLSDRSPLIFWTNNSLISSSENNFFTFVFDNREKKT